MAEIGDEYSPTSFYNSTHPISVNGETEKSLDSEMLNAKVECTKGRFHGISRVKNATKSVAKKFNRILTKLKKPLNKQTTTIENNDISVRKQSADRTSCTIHNSESAADNDHFETVDSNRSSMLSSNYSFESCATAESDWETVDDHRLYASDSCMDSCEHYASANSIDCPAVDQSDHWKNSCDGTFNGDTTADTVNLVPFIINRANSRSPILFRPDFYVTNTPEASSNAHHHHTLYQVSCDYYPTTIIDDNDHHHSTKNDAGIENTKLKIVDKISQIAAKLALSKEIRNRLSTIKWSAITASVFRKFLFYSDFDSPAAISMWTMSMPMYI